jgi:hypothetical protein
MHQGACPLREVDLATSLRAFRDLPMGVAVWRLRKPKDVRSLQLVGVNPAVERELRAPLGFAVGKSISECFPRLLDTPAPERYRRVVLSGKPDTLGELVYQDARIPKGVFWVDCFPLPEDCVGVAMENITERKRVVENQTLALQLLHRVTVFLNNAPTVTEATQFCVDEICTQIGLPVGRFFLADEMCPSRFIPNPVWHFSNVRRFRAFRKATELYERDLTNKLALQYRTIQGQKAGLARSIGFSVVENDFLRGVLDFSSEGLISLDEHIFRAISNVGFQLGQVFVRERLARGYGRVHGVRSSQETQSLKRTHDATFALSNDLVESTTLMQEHLVELKRLTARPIEFRPNSSLRLG